MPPIVEGDRVMAKEEFVNQFKPADQKKVLLVTRTQIGSIAKDLNWLELKDDTEVQISGSYGNTIFSENWVRKV